VKGLFPDEAAPPAPLPVAAPPLPAAPQQVLYTYGLGPIGQRRNLTWFLVLACVLLALGLAVNVVRFVEAIGEPPPENLADLFYSDELAISDLMACFGLLGHLGMVVFWLVWIFIVHQEVRTHAPGLHAIGPGLALGLAFVPFFHLFWCCSMPYRLAETIERHLVPRQGLCSATLVLLFSILSYFPGCCLLGLNWVFTALAMWQIQRGLNARWAMFGAA
jgi:hypothetical protein